MEEAYSRWIFRMLVNQGVPENMAIYLNVLVLLFALVLVAFLIDYITKQVFLNVVQQFSKRTKTTFDDSLYDRKVFHRLAHILPAIVVYRTAPEIFEDFKDLIPAVIAATNLYVTAVASLIIHSFLSAVGDSLSRVEKLKDKPVNSFIQVFKILNYFVAAIIFISIVIGKSPLVLFSALGAATAVLLLVFRDTILGLVSSIQLTFNDMIKVGDWIAMEKYGADGDVIEINLTTIKVRNWDRTITTIPPYALVSDSFKNWRGMAESGGRRIKRSINLKMSSVKFCDDTILDKYAQVELVRDYIHEKKKEIEEYNTSKGVNKNYRINGRNFTNLGIFRKYAENYLRANPKLNQDMTLMVRQLQPTSQGVPLEIYCFSADKQWVVYEGIMADIFDHLIAAVQDFDLELFEVPSGKDVTNLLQTKLD